MNESIRVTHRKKEISEGKHETQHNYKCQSNDMQFGKILKILQIPDVRDPERT